MEPGLILTSAKAESRRCSSTTQSRAVRVIKSVFKCCVLNLKVLHGYYASCRPYKKDFRIIKMFCWCSNTIVRNVFNRSLSKIGDCYNTCKIFFVAVWPGISEGGMSGFSEVCWKEKNMLLLSLLSDPNSTSVHHHMQREAPFNRWCAKCLFCHQT